MIWFNKQIFLKNSFFLSSVLVIRPEKIKKIKSIVFFLNNYKSLKFQMLTYLFLQKKSVNPLFLQKNCWPFIFENKKLLTLYFLQKKTVNPLFLQQKN